MSAQKASAPARLAAGLAAVVLVAVAAAVAVRLTHRRDLPAPAAVEPPPQGRAVDLKERIRQQEFESGRLVAEIRGDAFERGADGLNHLRGAIEVANLGPDGRVVSRLKAAEVVYAPGSLRFTVRGGVRVEAGDVVLEGETYDYDKAAGLFGTNSGGRFESTTLAGRAAEIAYDEAADEIRLGGGFLVEMTGPASEAKTLAVSGESLTYARRERRGRAEGRAELRGGGSLATAETIVFAVAANDEAVESAVLEGRAKASFMNDASKSGEGGEVDGDRITVAFARDPFAVRDASAEGKVRLTRREAGGAAVRVEAPVAALTFDRGGGLSGWSASGGVRAEIREADGSVRSLEGEKASFDRAADRIRAESVPGRRPVADSIEARVEADAVMICPAAGGLQASGGLRCVFRSETAGRTPGFFTPGEDVLVTCEAMSLAPGGASALFKGNVRARQDEGSLEADELEFSSEKGETRGRGGVAAALPGTPKDGEAAGAVLMRGQEMTYVAETRALSFTGRAAARLPEASLEARTVAAVVAPGGKSLRSLSARTDVIVRKGAYEGRAGAADYEAAADRVVLTGNPVLTDGKGGSARGTKLTFDLADDKILVENEGSGRSTTVIKS